MMKLTRGAGSTQCVALPRLALRQALVWLLLPLLVFTGYAADTFGPPFLERLWSDYGAEARERGRELNHLLLKLEGRPDSEKLREINRYFNRIPYADDIDHWLAQDYWATPEEFIGTNRGDCEDYVIAKYVALRAVGIPEGKLFLTYVKATELGVSHMVLTYFSTPSDTPLVLDNYDPRILPATERRDLLPIYSFNAESFFLTAETGGVARRLPPGKIKNRKWDALRNALGKEQQL